MPSPRSSEFSASSRCPLRSAWLSSICVRRIASSRALSHGFWMKSRAPRRIASTATSTLPQAVITTTGSVGSSALDPREQVEAFLARGRVARVVQVDQGDVELARFERREHAGRRRRGLELEPFRLEQQAQRFEDVGLIVGDEHARLARPHRMPDVLRRRRCAGSRVIGDQH